uniref:Tyrosyl-DNA phosphodiesterase 2 n=1 Tax=Esox lucius TaxID=8010 RepID=A0A3P8XVZ4_ESOLU
IARWPCSQFYQGSPVSLSLDQSSQQKTSPDQSSLSSPDEDKPKNKGDPNKLSLLTWNIDGLDMDDIKERCSKYHPDIVLLQEVISPTYQVLQQVLKPYHVLPGNDKSYFTAILLRKSRVQLLGSSIVNYPNTKMRRNLLVVSFLGQPLCVMTSHMESMKKSTSERQNQLRVLWRTMSEQPQDHNVIFGGDTNLRDWEVNNLGGLPEGICDIWESLGQPQDCRYTWDCITNDNKELPFPARLRFDRLFLRQAGEGSKVSPDGLTLVGLERLECDRFISDHWGLLCTFGKYILSLDLKTGT